MKIQWLGHSSFRLTESTGASIITDPFDPLTVGYDMACLPCDAITSSHGHSDHNHFKGVSGNPVIINEPGTFDVNGIKIHSVLTSHDTEEGALRGKNLIYQFRLDGVTVCHLGDIGEVCTPELIEQLIPVNILLIPVGGNYTIDAEQAKEYVDHIMPDVVIPMHFKTRRTELDIDKVENFLRLFDDETVIEHDADVLEFDRYDFDGAGTKIILPKRYKEQ
ncbi:MBL fold metallo-hydrolase [Pumilibacter muris]|jgi:L-ascorbate metabolism protein UlaG (beta-lactamase superfamily)|uniref:MBL fold metallo-hydrolase n=1 Tax=Pumilibacter muris TaxID=2941510 RepID=UPI00203C8F5F|nr:MBL fold metallo-hydrolase [Pumilibacter muris]